MVLHINAIVAFIGGAALLLLLVWKDAGKYFADWHGKLASEIAKGVVALGSIAFAVAEKKDLWIEPMVSMAVGIAIWATFSIILEAKVKAASRNVETESAEYEREATNRSRLIGVLCKAVRHKVVRLTKEIRKRAGGNPSLKQVREALTPQPHLNVLLEALATYLCDLLPAPRRETTDFRVGVYVAYNGSMTPVHGVSYRDPGYVPFTSVKAHPERFRLDAELPAHVVQVVRTRGMIVVEDCAKAASEGKFFYFNDHQPSYLRSMVSYYCGAMCLNDGTMTSVVLVVDSDAAGFFKYSEEQAIRSYLHEFAVRIKLELLLSTLVDGSGASHEQRTDTHADASEASIPSGSDGGARSTSGGKTASGIPSRDGEKREGAEVDHPSEIDG